MGLLAKTNPTATRESVIRHAWIFGTLSFVACLVYCLWNQLAFPNWLFFLPLATILGAALGALLEWQLDDGVEIYYVVMEVEEEFGIKIANWETLATMGDLYQAVLACLRESEMSTVDEDEIWQRLKDLLAKQLAIKPEKVVPTARFYIDLPM